MQKIFHYFELVTFSHTIFALPFALIGFLVALYVKGELFDGRLLIALLICMVTARTAAMAFNRLVDREIDALNPRTSRRHLPRGTVAPREAWLLVCVCCVVFLLTCWQINLWTLALSPVALAVVLGYSLTKYFTSLTHFILGLALGIAPVGAWIAVMNDIDLPPVVLGIGVLFWVAGFDILYALQDEEFDRQQSIRSLAVDLGRRGSLTLSSVLHALAALFFLLFGWSVGLGWLYVLGVLLVCLALYYEHKIITPVDISRVNTAFFTANGFVSILLLLFVLVDLYLV